LRVFLTGATGFLGDAIARELRRRDHDVTALVRSPGRVAMAPGVREIPGDVTLPDTYRDALRDHDALIHAAALVKMWARDRSEFDRVNVTGTESLLRAAADAGVPRIVYASSFMALGPSTGGPPLREDDPRRRATYDNDYERTKHLADVRARALIAEGLPLTVIYPGVIHGPGRLTDGNIVVRNVIRLLNGLPFGVSIRTWSYAFVDDVAGGFVRIAEQGAPSSRYVLGGDNRTGAEFYATLAEVSGKPAPRLMIPASLAWLSGAAEWALAQAFGREPKLLTHEVANVYRSDWAYDSSRAERELGYRPTSLRDALERTVAWLRSEGHVR
jgi:farnesol dehydrogenase